MKCNVMRAVREAVKKLPEEFTAYDVVPFLYGVIPPEQAVAQWKKVGLTLGLDPERELRLAHLEAHGLLWLVHNNLRSVGAVPVVGSGRPRKYRIERARLSKARCSPDLEQRKPA